MRTRLVAEGRGGLGWVRLGSPEGPEVGDFKEVDSDPALESIWLRSWTLDVQLGRQEVGERDWGHNWGPFP